MNFYEIDNYKSCLRAAMSERQKQFGSKYTYERMALACGVQKTYLSKVLNSSAHLNPDQLYAAGEFLKLTQTQIEFLSLLRESEIATHAKRAALLKTKLKRIREENLKTDSVLDVIPVNATESLNWEYFTDVDLQLVHMFLTVAEFAREPFRLCQRIGISEARLQSILVKLQQWQLVRFENDIYKAKDPKMHLPEDSPAFLAFGILNRIKTIEKIRQVKTDKSDDYFFSAVFSAETKYQVRLKRKILDFLKETQNEVLKSKSEQVYQFNIDFFKWS